MQHEELHQEKIALEKEMSISGNGERLVSTESKRSYRSDRDRSGTRPSNSPAAPSRSSSQTPGSANSSFDIMNILPLGTMNNLSNREAKVSNLSQPAQFQCPRCLQKFHVENSFQIHLDKCVE